MRMLRVVVVGALLTGAVVWTWRTDAPSRQAPATPVTTEATATLSLHRETPGSAGKHERVRVGLPADAEKAAAHREVIARLAYSQAWDGTDVPAELAAFREWTRRYQAASGAEQAALETEGVARARERRPVMRDLMVRAPQLALALTVPAVVRQQLPAAVRAELETRVAGVGEFAQQAMSYEGPRPEGSPAYRRTVFLGGETYTAHAYGRRAGQPSKEGASLHGIALDGEFALHESPVRVLEPGEKLDLAAPVYCAGSGAVVLEAFFEGGVNVEQVELAEAQGRVWEFCCGRAQLEDFEQRLTAAEEQPGPRVAALLSSGEANAGLPATAADAATPWTVGAKRVLVIRVDFSDFPGDPVPADTIGATLNGGVRTFFEEASYGLTTLSAQVTPTVYRMPRTGASYATANNTSGLHSDARSAASADFRLADFDRIMVVFGSLGTARVPGSQFTWAGLATVGGTNSWINNAFTMRTITHELGHNHGLKHASLWRVTDNNPLSAAGQSREYGDPFDQMGDASERDSRHHFNHWFKNLLGWLPDRAVTTVSASGTYRIYRYDSPDASLDRPLALRVFRDGVRWYWVGYRQNFPTNSSLTAGANVLWGFNASQESQLLDTATPGNTPLDSALAVGATLDDAVSGVKIRPLARGGGGADAWLDVELTVPAAPPRVVASWGGGQNFLDVPTAVTYVPFDLRNVVAAEGGASHVVALKSDGTALAWGDNVFGQTTVPATAELLTAVAAGGNVSGAIKSDGTVMLWGQISTGLLTPPEGLAGVTQLAIGTNHAVALRSNGTVVGWGSNTAGQISFPAGLNDAVAVSAGNQATLVLRRDGTVLALGGTGIRNVPAGLSGVVAVSVRGTTGLALRADGTVAAWGNNGNGQATVPAGLKDVIAIAGGDFHSLALRADGSVVAWGSNTSGKLNVPPGLPRATAITATSQASFATAGARVFITTPPATAAIAAGGAGTLSVSAVGAGTLTYQWRRDGVEITGATGASLALTNFTAAQTGSYDVVVRDGASALTSFPARITLAATTPPPAVTPPPAGLEVVRIGNLSILTAITSASDSLTMGYVVGGDGTSGAKPLLIRAAGPSLGVFGVAAPLADPKLELYVDSAKTGENDNWNGAADVAGMMAAVGAFPFAATTSRDSGAVASVGSSSNTVIVTGVGGATGAVLAEIYDGTPSAGFTGSVPRLLNVSVLKHIGTGLTAGFVIQGPENATRTVLIRAVGPTLGSAPFGVPGVIADPQMVLFGGNQARLGENNDWGGTAALTAAFRAVGAFPLSATSRDAALVASLRPGSYSVLVTGVGGTTGVALVEVYEVP